MVGLSSPIAHHFSSSNMYPQNIVKCKVLAVLVILYPQKCHPKVFDRYVLIIRQHAGKPHTT